MSKSIKIVLPKLGESIVSATVVQWFKQIGDSVALDEPLLEVSTDKVNSEIPSPVTGILTEMFADVGQEIQVGEPLASIALATAEPALSKEEEFLSPSVVRLLKEKGIALSEIDKIPHSGEGGRLTKKDVESYVAKPLPLKPCRLSACDSSSSSTEKVKMSPIRKAIADNMVKSFYQAPHASLITEVDVTHLLKLIQEEKESFFSKHGVKLTITTFVARAISQALQSFPLLNASLDGDTILMKRFVHLGIAVSVDQGVMVPVVKDCERKSLAEIAKEISSLAEKTRSHTLNPDEIQGGSITLTNFGMTGTMIGVPIIRYPEVAIIGLGAITKKVVAMPDDFIAIRSVMFVSLTFDHRVLDGIYGCNFLGELKKILEKDICIYPT